MRATAVIGANFGDEGKGLVTDYLCSVEEHGMVVRYNGGAQAGHTVVTPDDRRHVFSHFGSGSFLGVPTFLSQFFVCNPILFLREYDQLIDLGLKPTVYAHPNCLVTTFADMIINQNMENDRGDLRHGSCGIGFNETIIRSKIDSLKITMSDLWNSISLEDRLVKTCNKYADFRCGRAIKNPDKMIAEFILRANKFAEMVHPLGIVQCKDPIFEGAQGLLLDMDNREFFPHLTHSNTGMKNIRILCEQAGIKDITAFYVTRTYVTRHGQGMLPGEDPKMKFDDDTNIENEYQGKIKFAPIDYNSLIKRCTKDFGSLDFRIFSTHCDQVPAAIAASFYSSGPSRTDVNLQQVKRIAS